MQNNIIDKLGIAQPTPNNAYADLHRVYWDTRKGKNEQVRLVASDDGKTFNIIRGREGVRVGPDKSRSFGPYDIKEYGAEFQKLLDQGFLCTFDKAPKEVKLKEKEGYEPMPDPYVDEIIKGLVECSRQAFEETYTVSIKRILDIPPENVDEARKVLRFLDGEKDHLSEREFNQALMVVYEVLPRKIDNLQKVIAKTPEDFAPIIQRESEMISMLEAQIKQAAVQAVTVTTKPNICKNYGFDVRPVTPEEKDEIFSRLHGIDPGSGDTYDVRQYYKSGMRIIYNDDNEINTRFEKYCDSHCIGTSDYEHGMKLLFHGSGTENFWNIMKIGWLLNPDADICGKAYGNGIYFAPSSEKSINYASSRSTWRAADNSVRAFLSMADVAVGKIYDVEHSSNGIPRDAHQLEEKCPGADCLWAFGGNGCTFRHDEVVVYRECQARMKYLIEVS